MHNRFSPQGRTTAPHLRDAQPLTARMHNRSPHGCTTAHLTDAQPLTSRMHNRSPHGCTTASTTRTRTSDSRTERARQNRDVFVDIELVFDSFARVVAARNRRFGFIEHALKRADKGRNIARIHEQAG